MSSLSETEEYRQENLALKRQIEERAGKTVEELFQERDKRSRAAVELKKADRVPFFYLLDVQTFAGVPNAASYYDPLRMKRAMRQAAVDLEPDMADGGFPSCGNAMTELDVKNVLWPGGPLPPDAGL